MISKVGWIVAGIFFIIFVVMSFYLNHLSSLSRQVPVFMPLVVGGGDQSPGPPGSPPMPVEPSHMPDSAMGAPPVDSPRPVKKQQDIEMAGVETATILHRAGRLGPTVSIEDFVRGLLLLSQESGELGLTKKQKEELRPIIQNAYDKRIKLLKISEEIQGITKELPEQAKQAAGKLTSTQIETIQHSRDKISILSFEDDYWRDLMASLDRK